jgi:PAS domain S-box-containing protein
MPAESSLERWQPTILIVDDTKVNRLVFSAALKQHAHIVTAESGVVALRLVEEVNPNLILLDVMMPDMDGYETAAALRANPRIASIPIIFLTALTDNDSQIRGLALGAVDFLSKPVNMAVLRHRVANALERERLHLQALEQERQLKLELQRACEVRDLLESVFQASRSALFVADSPLHIIRLNKAGEALAEGAGALCLGGALNQLLLEDDTGKDLTLDALRSSGRAIECHLVLAQDRRVPVAALFQSFVVEGRHQHYLLSLQDLSARRALEEAKKRAEATARDVFADLAAQKLAIDQHALACITDFRGRITYVNEHFCTVSGYGSDELLGTDLSLLRSELCPAALSGDILAATARGDMWQGEIPYRAKDGGTYWVYSTITKWMADDGIAYEFSVSTDITRLKETEEALRRMRSRELKIGSDIQDRLLFAKPPDVTPGLNVAYYSEGSQGIDGDFYSFTQIDENRLDVLTGDVMGKGAAAALIGAAVKGRYPRVMLKLIIADPLHRMPSPEAIVNALHEDMTPELISLDKFVTLTLLRIDRRAQTVTWVNAGHTPLLLGRAAGTCVERLEGDHLPVGVLPEERYVQQTVSLEVGDAVLIYSDGLSEAVNDAGEFYGDEPIAGILQGGLAAGLSASIILTSLRSDLHNHTDFEVGQDDRTALVIQVRPMRNAPRGTIKDRKAPEYLDLPRQLDQLTPLRRRIEVILADQSEEFADELRLAVFEAATNIIRHSPKRLEDAPFTAVFKRSGGAAAVELMYEGEAYKPGDVTDPDFTGNTEGGFGQWIMEQYLDQVRYYSPMPGMASVFMTKNFPQGDVPAGADEI